MRRLLGSKRMHFTALIAGIGLLLWAMSSGVLLFAQEPPPQLPVTVSGEEIIGTPWTGPAGITETLDEIMVRAREADAFVGPRLVREQIEPAELDRENLPQNPDAPAISSWPPRSGNAWAMDEVIAIPRNPQTVGTTFMGPQLSDSGYIPPDTMGAVGPDQVLIILNGRIRVFDKAGIMGGLNATTDSFFASVMTAGSGTSDPHVRYDRLSSRWYIVMIDVATINKVLIAVSSGPHVSSSSSFTFYAFQHDLVGTTPNTDTGGFVDYPTLGVDANALYIGGDVVNAAGTAWIGASVYVVNKANLLAGTLTVTPFRQIGAAGGTGGGMWAPQGVDNDGPGATEGYFTGVDNQYYSTLVIRRVSNPGGPSPSLSANINITVPTTYTPIGVPYRKASNINQTITLDALDDRLFAAAVHTDKLTGASSLWTAHSIKVDSSGVGGSAGDRDGCRWYQIGSLSTSPVLVQSGTLVDSAAFATNPYFYWMPSVAMSGQGHMALGCSSANGTDKTSPKYASAAVAGRLSGDASGTTQAATIAFTGSGFYNQTDTSGRNRWGDFSQTVVDPTDDQTMWTFQEYVNTTGSPYTYGSWAVRAIQLKAPLPATPASCSPATICQGATSVSVTVTGTSTSGTGFFDPGPDTGGPGFANHIAASVSGAGVTVNSVTFTDSTHVTLSLTIAAGAAAGARDITITNPDGQTNTGAGILTINALPAAPAAPTFTSVGQTTLTVNWSAVSGATTYDVWRQSGGSCTGAVKITGSPVAVTNYPDSGLTCNSQYSYFVTANNGCGTSSNGTCNTQTTATCSAPLPNRVPYSVTPNRITTANHGIDGAVIWDVSNCASSDYHILYGWGSGISTYATQGAKCNMTTSGTYSWTSMPDPTVDPSNFMWFVIVGDNNSTTEGSWGLDSAGSERHPGSASNLCSCTTKDVTQTCGTP